jgi:hypothetical protein
VEWEHSEKTQKLTGHAVLVGLAPLLLAGAVGGGFMIGSRGLVLPLVLPLISGIFVAVIGLPVAAFVPAILVLCGLLVRVVVLFGLVAVPAHSRGYGAKE